MREFGFENITVPKQTYAVFTTENQPYPVDDYVDIRKRIVSEWLPANNFEIANAPEISVYHWFPKNEKEERFIEIWLPIVQKYHFAAQYLWAAFLNSLTQPAVALW